jgi:hypothetical protein
MNYVITIVAIGFALAVTLPTAPATALNGRSFVSPVGDDGNDCTLGSPCRNLQAALAKTDAGGEIAVLGTADYNGGTTVTIDKAISIVNPAGFEARIVPPSSANGIEINAGTNDAVTLRGLTIEGAGVGPPAPQNGIRFNVGKSLTIENCVGRHLAGDGIYFSPNATSSLSVSNSVMSDNLDTGIYVVPSGPSSSSVVSGVVSVVLNHVEVNNNGNGIVVSGGNSTGMVNATVYDSVAVGNNPVGLLAVTTKGRAPVTLMLFHSIIANTTGWGLNAQGPGAIIRVAHSVVTANTNGWFTSDSAVVQIYGNNYIDGNTGNESAPPSIARK